MSKVAALYVDPRGPYIKLLGPDMCWDEARDARTYAGPWPVIAHPPCGPWSRNAFASRQDPTLAVIALGQVRRLGGVLEHPADSRLWKHDIVLAGHLGRFGAHVDCYGGRCISVDQVEWGHACRKRSWLYIVGRTASSVRPPYPGRQTTHWCRKQPGQVVPRGIKMASREIRRRTPPAFAEWLISIAACTESERQAS